jgi:hypothetical protein
MVRARVVAALAVSAFLAGAGSASAAEPANVAYALAGPDGGEVVRALTTLPACPDLEVDGARQAMRERAAPAVLPLRPTASAPAPSKPSAFPRRVCEARVPRGTQRLSLGGQALPVLPREVRRIVVIGDTGCRLKAADSAYQACDDPRRYPLAEIAASAARWRPDLVIHVGDYLYRENPCPDANAGCAGSPWGYGGDAWDADLFGPAAPLLAAAPWVFVRGNHETCVRAGQGWARFLSPWPLNAGSDCADPAHDATGDFTAPYALDLDRDTRLIAYDSASTPNAPLDPADRRAVAYARAMTQIAALAKGVPHVFLADHHPLLAFAAKTPKPGEPIRLAPGNLGLQSVFARAEPGMFPANVDLLLSGHVHVEEQLSFKDARFPSQLVTGFSGTQEDINPMPAQPPTDEPAPGAVVETFSSWVEGFGFATMEREGPGRWRIEIHDRTGRVVDTCRLEGRRSRCAVDQVAAEYGAPSPAR